ncbi:hypothetical protein ACGFIF_36020 [Kribbella sp. NPDC049174]|uniref:hypothetical protein n=1 Tax=Kribbella sp. NPDC049174 TaxID=3364112 RepID=UPI00371E5B75
MRIKRVMAALLAAPLVGLLLGGVPAAQADPDPNLTITAVTLEKTAIAVSGLNTAPIKATVKGGYDSTEPGDENLALNVVLERTGGTGPLKTIFSTDLKRLSGTLQNGVWSGTLNATSTANGTFKVTGVVTGPYGAPIGGTPYDATPFDGPPLAVTGTHLPKVTASVSPKVVPFGSPYSIRWAIIDTATGKPHGSRIRALLGVDVPCAEDSGGGESVRTDTNGTVTKSYKAVDADALNCLRLTGAPYDIGGQWLFVARPGIVSATPSKTSAPVGTIVPVNGSVAGAPYNCKVWLQRLYGATQWRSVGSGAVRQSGRFTVNAQPAYKGLIPYRVYLPACYNYQPGVSKVFYIRGL